MEGLRLLKLLTSRSDIAGLHSNPRDEVESPPQVINAHAFCSCYCFTAIDLRVIIRQLFLTGFTANCFIFFRYFFRPTGSRPFAYFAIVNARGTCNRKRALVVFCLQTHKHRPWTTSIIFLLLCNTCEYIFPFCIVSKWKETLFGNWPQVLGRQSRLPPRTRAAPFVENTTSPLLGGGQVINIGSWFFSPKACSNSKVFNLAAFKKKKKKFTVSRLYSNVITRKLTRYRQRRSGTDWAARDTGSCSGSCPGGPLQI